MTCIYTGAYVHFDEYGFSVPADLFSVGDCYVVRWLPSGRTYDDPQRQITHRVTIGRGFHREDLGVSVVDSGGLAKTQYAEERG